MRAGGWRLFCLWQGRDFYGYHRGRVAFQDDHERDLDLRRRGFDVHRFSELQVNDSAEEVAADLRDAFGLAS